MTAGSGFANPIVPGGTPLLHGVNNIVLAGTLTVPAASSQSTGNPKPVARPGIILDIIAVQAAAATLPFLNVTLRWYDTTATTIVYREDFVMPTTTGAGGATGVQVMAPVRGAFFTLTFANLDPAQSAAVTYTVLGSTHHIARTDPRSTAIFGPAGTLVYAPGAVPTANILLDSATSLTSLQVDTWLLPLYAGQVVMSLTFGGAVQVQIETVPIPQVNGGSLSIFNAVGAGITMLNQQPLTLPRIPCTLTLANTLSSTNNGNISIIALEYAS